MITVRTPINIALCKYWGKEDEELIIPCNSSISATLSTEHLFTETTVSIQHSEATEDSFFLNGEQCAIGKRLRDCIQRLRMEARDHFPQFAAPLLICSWNSFPTAAGMASSASGLAAVCLALWKLYGLSGVVSRERLSCIARMASGSACRSLFGGFVEWKSGQEAEEEVGSEEEREEEVGSKEQNTERTILFTRTKANSQTANSILPSGQELKQETNALNLPKSTASYAFQLAPSFPDLCILVYPFSTKAKALSSTRAMQRTKETSPLFPFRVSHVVPQRLAVIRESIHSKNIPALFKAIMQDSNNFHATCLDSWPPISYLSADSWKLIEAVHEFNAIGEIEKAAYSFDAGSNGFLFIQQPVLKEWLEFVEKFDFPSPIVTRMSTLEEEHSLWAE